MSRVKKLVSLVFEMVGSKRREVESSFRYKTLLGMETLFQTTTGRDFIEIFTSSF